MNKNVLIGTGKLPEVQKRERTEFKEFILSGKRPIYTGEKENLIERAEAAMQFKAKKLNKKIMDKPDFVP